VHYLTSTLLLSAIAHESAVGGLEGQAENSGMIDGCQNEQAREIGALLRALSEGGTITRSKRLFFERATSGEKHRW